MLTAHNLLERDKQTGKYLAGPELYTLGSLFLNTTDIFKAAEPVVTMLNDLTKETINIAILNKGDIVLVVKQDAQHAFRYAAHIGTVLPAYASAVGKALLSDLSAEDLDSLYKEDLTPMTKHTLKTKRKLKLELEEIRKTGISIDIEEGFDGVAAVASTICNVNKKAVAAISISVPVYKMTEPVRMRFSNMIKIGAKLINYRLGCRDTSLSVRSLDELKKYLEGEVSTGV